MSMSVRKALPAGAVIEFCEERGVVLFDAGGDCRITVRVGDHQADWYWTLGGIACTLISLPAAADVVDKFDLAWHLEQAVQEPDLDAIGLAHNMTDASLDQLHEIIAFADRLKEAALTEMFGREREVLGFDASQLTTPPAGYVGYRHTR
jgi:hypothetical protein